MAPADAKNLQEAVKFVQEHVPEGQEIFVGNIRHDMYNTSHIMFYFLAERHSATMYFGFASTLEIQKQIVNDLNRQSVKYVVIWIPHIAAPEPNKSGESSGVTLLDDFIRTNYRAVGFLGTYIVLRRRA